MKRQVFALVFTLLSAIGLDAQITDRAIESIRIRYNEISEKVRLAESDKDHGQTGEIVMNELTINKLGRQWRAVGIYGQKVKFFYNGGEDEKRLYPDRLVMVKIERDVSARKYYEEFLYSETGALIFYFQKAEGDDDAPAERRIYFSENRPIRIIEDGKTRDRLTAADNAVSKRISTASNKLSEIFKRSIDL